MGLGEGGGIWGQGKVGEGGRWGKGEGGGRVEGEVKGGMIGA